MGSSDLAAWVQTGGSLIGLAVAIAVPYVQHKKAAQVRRDDLDRQDKQREDRARTLAIAVSRGFNQLKWSCGWLLGKWPEGQPASSMLPHPEEQRYGPSELDLFEIPDVLEASKGVLHDLAAAAEPAQKAYFHAQVAVLRISLLEQEGEYYYNDEIRPEIVKCLEATNRAIAEIERLLE